MHFPQDGCGWAGTGTVLDAVLAVGNGPMLRELVLAIGIPLAQLLLVVRRRT
ncbi:hypothetical protein KBZ14_07965 [Synechococcus sp. HJ21-Hayes]|uniref:hypothetical protein n=1 Tax=Synechococcus sp. HJ21-Hayes TaxID=2823736 RepID=UPI0020CD8364|nr:hypothetical protein [Synechococcus sp. HJ21-Hayes]MCP9852806.1 hypothetical protein [Synechococcus sp. HJ21-Hayes]